MTWVKDGLEVAGITFWLYCSYLGFMHVTYKVLDWFLTKMGYPNEG